MLETETEEILLRQTAGAPHQMSNSEECPSVEILDRCEHHPSRHLQPSIRESLKNLAGTFHHRFGQDKVNIFFVEELTVYLSLPGTFILYSSTIETKVGSSLTFTSSQGECFCILCFFLLLN